MEYRIGHLFPRAVNEKWLILPFECSGGDAAQRTCEKGSIVNHAQSAGSVVTRREEKGMVEV